MNRAVLPSSFHHGKPRFCGITLLWRTHARRCWGLYPHAGASAVCRVQRIHTTLYVFSMVWVSAAVAYYQFVPPSLPSPDGFYETLIVSAWVLAQRWSIPSLFVFYPRPFTLCSTAPRAVAVAGGLAFLALGVGVIFGKFGINFVTLVRGATSLGYHV